MKYCIHQYLFLLFQGCGFCQAGRVVRKYGDERRTETVEVEVVSVPTGPPPGGHWGGRVHPTPMTYDPAPVHVQPTAPPYEGKAYPM